MTVLMLEADAEAFLRRADGRLLKEPVPAGRLRLATTPSTVCASSLIVSRN